MVTGRDVRWAEKVIQRHRRAQLLKWLRSRMCNTYGVAP
jgi:hypothetical protein